MSPFLYALYGALVGALLGIGGPVLAAYAFAWLDGFKPGGNGAVGTAFSLMILFTCPLGMLLGARLGFLRAKTGSWFSAVQDGFWRRNSTLGGGRGINAVARSLSQDRIDEFLADESNTTVDVLLEAKKVFLSQAIEDYRTLLRINIRTLIIIAGLSIVFIPGWILFVYYAGYVCRQVFIMRSCLWSTAEDWEIQLNTIEFDLPITLQK